MTNGNQEQAESSTTPVELDTAAKDAKAAQLSAVEVIAGCLKQVRGKSIGEGLFVPIMIFNRISQIHWATVLLVEHHLFSEGLILLATEFELLLDLLFVGRKTVRATQWLEYTSTKTSPWPVAIKIDSIFKKNEVKKAGAHKLYEILCTVKHANPAAGVLGFSVKREGEQVVFNPDEMYGEQTAVGAFVISSSTYMMSWAALLVRGAVSHYVQVEPESYDELKGWLDWGAKLASDALNAPEFADFGDGKSLAVMLDLPEHLNPSS